MCASVSVDLAMSCPAVVVHGLAHAQLALGLGRSVCLLSARGAGRYAGTAWWQAMIRAATPANTPGICDVLDCDDAAGAAMAAIRHGQARLILDRRCAAFERVAAAAAQFGCCVMDRRPPALDLALPGALRSLPAWLDSQPGV